MTDLTIRTIDGGEARVDAAKLSRLADDFDGTLLTPDSPGYDEARTIWNAMIDRRPALIARCASADDVVRAVRFARERDLLVSVRGGGHNIAGSAVCDGGVMIHLGSMRDVTVDAGARTARVQAGATLGDLDAATQEEALATTTGINSTTGIAGLTLGGGFGWLSRKYGMTVDNLRSVEIVTADGEPRRASADENPDLFWAVRGGGGNFGVVTSFEYRLHPVGPEVLSGPIVHPLDGARALLRFYRDFADGLPNETAVYPVIRKAPPFPFLPEEWHGRPVVILAAFHAGDMAEGERLLRPLREFGEPLADMVGPHPYAGWQQAFDPVLTPGARNYWKSHDLAALSDDALDTVIEHAGTLPSPHTEIVLIQLGGEMARVAPDATAYPHRATDFVVNLHTRWEDPADDERCIAWARGLFDALAPHSTGGVYVNFMPQDETERVRGAYGPNYDRLVRIKTRYDPDNFFRLNQNIPPAVHA